MIAYAALNYLVLAFLPARALNSKIDNRLSESDPAEIKAKLWEQQKYIEQLERDLGFGGK